MPSAFAQRRNFVPIFWRLSMPRAGMAPASAGVTGWLIGLAAWTAKLLFGAALLGLWEVSIAKMRVFRLPDFVGIAFVFGFLAMLLAFLTRGVFA